MDAKELKGILGDRAREIIAKGIPLSKYNSRTTEALCPMHQEDTPSFSWFDDGNCFKCFGCGGTMDIFDYLMFYESIDFMTAKQKVAELVGNASYAKEPKKKSKPVVDYKKPTHKLSALDEPFYVYLEGRKLRRETVDFWKVQGSIVNFAKKGEPEDVRHGMAFACYDEHGELKHTTHRSMDKKIKQEYQTEKILWGMWHVNPTKPLCIVEGQIDSMSVWQSGYKNVVSVPSGSKNYDWIENNYDWLMQFDDIVVWIDSDLPGQQMGQEIKARLPQSRVIKHPVYGDPNEMLMHTNEKAVYEFVSQKPEMPDGTVLIEQTEYNTECAPETDRIETGFHDLDSHINDIRRKQLTLIFGRDGEGKTTFVSQIVTHQLLRGEKTFLYSAELGQQALQDWLFRQVVGNNSEYFTSRKDKYEYVYSIKREVVDALKRWIGDKLVLVDDRNFEALKNTEKLIGMMKTLAKKHGVKTFILDNLQSIMPESNGDVNEGQSRFVEALRTFALTDNVSVILVAHPRKVEELSTKNGDVDFGNLTKNDVSGSKNISNKAHNVISIERDMDAVYFDVILTVLKDKFKGIRKAFKYRFDAKSLRYYNDSTPSDVPTPWKKCIPQTVKYYNGAEQTFDNG